MKKQTGRPQTTQAPDNKKPLDRREFPLARDSRGSAARDEIRSRTSMISAPRKSNRPAERSRQKRAHTR